MQVDEKANAGGEEIWMSVTVPQKDDYDIHPIPGIAEVGELLRNKPLKSAKNINTQKVYS